jgi:hypothetical protein
VKNESMTDRNGRPKEDRKDSDSDDIESLSDNPEDEDEEEVVSEEEESEEAAKPVKRGPAFGAAAAKK